MSNNTVKAMDEFVKLVCYYGYLLPRYLDRRVEKFSQFSVHKNAFPLIKSGVSFGKGASIRILLEGHY